jgi:hypothetical protein
MPDRRQGPRRFPPHREGPGFGAGALDQRVADFHDLVGDALQKLRPLLDPGLAVDVEGFPGEPACAINIFAAGKGEGGLELSPVAGLMAQNERSLPATR